MSLFTSLRRQHLSTDEKEHDSDSDDQQNNTRTPLLSSSSSSLFPEHNSHSTESSLFSLRIKLNDGTQPNNSSDFVLEGISPGVTSVGELKGAILKKHSSSSNSNGDGTHSGNDTNGNNRYLRLIVRGRMMAPDTSTLDKFSITKNDVIHAILAKEGTRGGQQARMLRRLNKSSPNNNGVTTGGGDGTSNGLTGGVSAIGGRASSSAGGNTNNISLSNRLLRRIGIDSNGIVISLASSNSNEDDDSSEESEDEESEDEVDLEVGNTTSRTTRRRGQRERRQRERRGFDRLRSTGMTRDEVTAIRLYFARSLDRYIERRRVMIRAARQMRDGAASNNTTEGGVSRHGSSTGESNTSHVEIDEETGSSTASTSTPAPGAVDSSTATNNSSSNNNDDEEILTDRRRMEDEWMSTQGPYSEFRMNLNTSNPLLLAAISGGAANVAEDAAAAMRLNAAMGINPNGNRGGGLFFRRAAAAVNAAAVALEVDNDEDEEEEEEDDLMFGGTLNPNGTYVPRAGVHPMYMGPLPSAGTEKDFVWGFILGFFVGYIMLFWVWMPTVTHKQKVGIILGICFQLGMSLMLKNNGYAHI
eukprot:CAMPEP_0201688814 /NCGR_PEP_ID=MMETSP0578-20130828/2517_1 /ASSEMBLY_ACC=CAM_ASM_000663 /TAXON_ID=267565 /ORGANISM="Skeletonema grethea, Strain CCMP 1804" /LENGTH=585 /DNA_ID=CAMNT_0048173273 /DNA_START=253 /DNA_END=2010 /DNA_ORIENTATION=+